jgi:tetraacyldisaccharide 4'-kinase
MTFADHHSFKRKDIERLNETFEAMPSPKRIITTEKDAARLTCIEGLSDEVKKNLFVLPVRISFMLDQEDAFNQYITGYVRKNSRKNILMKGKSDHKPTSIPKNDGKPKTISFK